MPNNREDWAMSKKILYQKMFYDKNLIDLVSPTQKIESW